MDPGSSSLSRRRIIIRNEDQLIGVASWEQGDYFNKVVRLHLYLNEETPSTDRVIDHLFETVFRDAKPFLPRTIRLYTASEQTRTIATALQRGFVEPFSPDHDETRERLAKFCFGGIVYKNNWSEFSNAFREATGLSLPAECPSLPEFTNTGVPVEMNERQEKFLIQLFDFETLSSPAIVLCPQRAGLIVPIRPHFAEELFPELSDQLSLMPSKEAILHIEKAYFRAPRDVKPFSKGTPILFYQSGKTGGSVIGCGRITSSGIIRVEDVEVSLWRQGVISVQELKKIADKSGTVHVVTFDNINLFPKKVPYSFLRNKELISGANLVTFEKLRADQLTLICKCGFGLEKIS